MIDPATQAEVLRLSYAEKKSQRAIAFELGLHRATVAAILRRRSVATTRKDGGSRTSLLAPYYAQIEELLRRAPSRSAMNLLQTLRLSGYRGGITILADYLRACRPPSEPKAYLSLEFQPGQAAQIDWGEFGDVFGLGRKVHAFVMVLCFSRMLYLEFTLSANLPSFLRCHERALSFFGGVVQEMWYDNLATAVAERKGRLIRFHPHFFVYAGHHSFKPIACNLGAGHEKGRVEDGVRYVRYTFWPGRSFTNLSDLNAQATTWCNTFANQRTHRSTRKIPELLFEKEQRVLQPLRPDGFDTDEVRSTRVSPQFRISFDGNTYSVPWRLSGKIITLRATDQTVTMFYGSKKIARHSRSWDKGQEIVHPRHEEGLRERKPGATPDRDLAALASLGPHAERYLKLLGSQSTSLRSEVHRLMVLVTVYGEAAVERIMGQALDTGIVGAIHLERWLEQDLTSEKKPPPLKLSNPHLNIPHTRPDLRSYDALLLKNEEEDERPPQPPPGES